MSRIDHIVAIVEKLAAGDGTVLGADPIGVAEIFYAASHYIRCTPEATKAITEATRILLGTVDPSFLDEIVKEADQQAALNAEMHREAVDEDARAEAVH